MVQFDESAWGVQIAILHPMLFSMALVALKTAEEGAISQFSFILARWLQITLQIEKTSQK